MITFNVMRGFLRFLLIKANAYRAYSDAAPRNLLKVMTTTKQWVRPRIHICSPTIANKSFRDETVNRSERIICTLALECEMHGHYELRARVSNAISGEFQLSENKL